MKSTPHMFVIAKDGTLAYDGAIDNRPQPFGDPRTAKISSARPWMNCLPANP